MAAGFTFLTAYSVPAASTIFKNKKPLIFKGFLFFW